MRTRTGTTTHSLPLLALLLLGGICFAQERITTLQAMAHGQGNQVGMTIGVTITIDSYSTAEDRRAVWEAFDKGGEQGLVKAILAVPARGHLSFAGVADYEIAYIRVFPAPNGRKVRVVARRPLPFGQARRYENLDYLFSAAEFDLNAEPGKSTGTFMPACDLSINKDKEIEILTYQSPWGLDQVVAKGD